MNLLYSSNVKILINFHAKLKIPAASCGVSERCCSSDNNQNHDAKFYLLG